ncbi:TlpA family protein disulfide reductase [Anaerobacillus sp. CMMVII]|uniref:TlpA disulfide reductase family protein n=1 Tax=Anaerobacillus sp. CMMVII TaxID=2755588 RepID=UPI0021B7820A|nr:TlpA disulfide reductase family protein [Anaerobacillus sp. CMMVII]MCT8138946.1 TlpA family protein disulfide reductase [Anaerobacillus sp. CMMVII]
MLAPTFTLPQLNGEGVISIKSYRGKPLVLTFWTSWCPDCQKDLHFKDQFYRTIDPDKLGFLTINVTGREGQPEDGKRLIAEKNYSFPVLMDDGTKVYDAYQCMGVPTTVIINRHQEIVAKYNDKAKFVEIIQGLGKIL